MVTQFSSKEMAERVTLRICLESMACAEAAQRMSEADYEALNRLLDALNDTVREGDPFARVQADLNFHGFIWERSDNGTLLRMLHELTAPLFAFTCILRKRGVVKLQPIINPHEEIVRALRTRDRRAIEAAVTDHIRPSYERFIRAAEAAGHALAPDLSQGN
jgi:DNA-binding GntR family transcriptional regulator